MATLTVWEFPTALGAERAESILEQLQKQELIKVHDAAIVLWPEGAKRPKTRQLNNLAAAGGLGGAFGGLLFGLIFFVPLFGMAIGAVVMTSDAVMDKVEAAFEGMDMKLVTTNLSNEQEQALRHAFGEDKGRSPDATRPSRQHDG